MLLRILHFHLNTVEYFSCFITGPGVGTRNLTLWGTPSSPDGAAGASGHSRKRLDYGIGRFRLQHCDGRWVTLGLPPGKQQSRVCHLPDNVIRKL